MIVSPGINIFKSARQRLSVNKNENTLGLMIIKRVSGNEIIAHAKIPLETVCLSPATLFCVLKRINILEIVMGIPDAVTVSKSPKTDKAIWYTPSDSEPSRLDKKIL